MTKKFYSRLLPITAVAIALSSCIEVTETVHLKVDGSGMIVEETIMGAQMSAMIAQMAALEPLNAEEKALVIDAKDSRLRLNPGGLPIP